VLLAVSGTVYTATITPDCSDPCVSAISIDVPGGAVVDGTSDENESGGATFDITYDSAPPTVVSMLCTQGSPTSTTPLEISFIFSEYVFGLVQQDFTVTGGTLDSFSFTDGSSSATGNISPSNNVYSAIGISIFSGQFRDEANYYNDDVPVETFIFDNQDPTCVLSGSVVGHYLIITGTFSEEVTGVDYDDLYVTNAGEIAPILNSSLADEWIYTWIFQPLSDYITLTALLEDGRVTDVVGHDNDPSNVLTILFNYDECIDNPTCGEFGTCIDGSVGFDCLCDPGWKTENCTEQASAILLEGSSGKIQFDGFQLQRVADGLQLLANLRLSQLVIDQGLVVNGTDVIALVDEITSKIEYLESLIAAEPVKGGGSDDEGFNPGNNDEG